MIDNLDEAIKHCEELAKKNEEESKNWAYGASQIDDDENRKKQYQKHAEMWQECADEHRQLAEWLRELKAYKDKDMRLIYANPLGEAIRCAMCTNPIKSDRGCDGGCKVDDQMYKKVMEAVNGLIVEVNADEESE